MRDLTKDFTSLCDTVSRRGGVIAPAPRLQETSAAKRLSQDAAAIGQSIWATSQKLLELTRLARTSSPFGDPSARIDELTFLVKADLARAQQALTLLESNARASSSPPAGVMVQQLNTSLVEAGRDFTHALEARTESLKRLQERRARWGGAVRVGPVPQLRPDEEDDGGAAELAIAVPLVATDDLLLERHDQVRSLEGHIEEVRTMFRRLASVVVHQGEQISRLEDNVGEAEGHAQEGHRQLLRFLNTAVSERWLIAKVFGVLLLFLFLFIVFFV